MLQAGNVPSHAQSEELHPFPPASACCGLSKEVSGWGPQDVLQQHPGVDLAEARGLVQEPVVKASLQACQI